MEDGARHQKVVMHDHFLIRHKFPKSLEMFLCRGRMSHFDVWVAQRCCLPGPKTSDQSLLKKIGSYWQWRTPENSTTIYRKVRWGRCRFSSLLPSTLSETPASSLQPIGCRDYPNISNQQPADSRFRRVSEAPGQEATNMRPGWPSEREGKGGLPGCLVMFSAAS